MYEDAGKCYVLVKAIYGLKQAGRQWYECLDAQLQKFGFQKCQSEPCVYVRGRHESRVILVVYVDDIMIITKHQNRLDACKEQLKSVLSSFNLDLISNTASWRGAGGWRRCW